MPPRANNSDVVEGSKRCVTCGVVKPLAAFDVRDPRTGTRRGECRVCRRVRANRNRADAAQVALRRARERRPEFAARRKERARRPEAAAANRRRSAANRATLKGKVYRAMWLAEDRLRRELLADPDSAMAEKWARKFEACYREWTRITRALESGQVQVPRDGTLR